MFGFTAKNYFHSLVPCFWIQFLSFLLFLSPTIIENLLIYFLTGCDKKRILHIWR